MTIAPNSALRPNWNFKFHLCPASLYCVFWSRTLNINVGLLADYFLPIMSDYTSIASKQSTRLLHTLFGSQWFGVFWQWFGSKLVGNRDRRHYVVPQHRVVERSFCMYQLLHFCKFLVKSNIDLELNCIFGKPIKCRFQRFIVRVEILSSFHARVEYISVNQQTINRPRSITLNFYRY